MAQSTYHRLVSGLETDLIRQATVVERYERYYLGHQPLRYTAEKWQKNFGAQLAELTNNFCQLVVDSSAERLAVEGFNFPSVSGRATRRTAPRRLRAGEPGDEPELEDVGADDVAWGIWQDNNLDSMQAMAHTTAIYAGRAYTLTAPPERPGESARITVEHPAQMYVRMDAGVQGRRIAAIKRWQELNDDGTPGDWLVTIYTPQATYRLRRTDRKVAGTDEFRTEFLPRTGDDLVDEIPNAVGLVPAVPLENRPLLAAAGRMLRADRHLSGGLSDLHTVLPLQDAVTKLLGDLLIMSEARSFGQRWATGIEAPTDDDDEPLDRDEWLADKDRVWTATDPGAKFGEFPTHDGSGQVEQIQMLIQHIAAQTRTPPHYLLGSMVNIAADGMKTAETGLAARTRGKHAPLGDGWEETMRLACGFMGDETRARDRRCEAQWSDPEIRSEGEAMDAALKAWQGKLLPLEMVLERLKYSPQQIKRAIRLLGMPDRPTPPESTPPGETSDGAPAPPAPPALPAAA
jgi:hypothetical protein